MDTTKLNDHLNNVYPIHEDTSPTDKETLIMFRNHVRDGAKWAVDNYPINWLDPKTSPPVLTFESDPGEFQQSHYYTDPLFLFDIEGEGFKGCGISLDNKTIDHYIGEDTRFEKDEIIAYCPIKTPEWYNKSSE